MWYLLVKNLPRHPLSTFRRTRWWRHCRTCLPISLRAATHQPAHGTPPTLLRTRPAGQPKPRRRCSTRMPPATLCVTARDLARGRPRVASDPTLRLPCCRRLWPCAPPPGLSPLAHRRQPYAPPPPRLAAHARLGREEDGGRERTRGEGCEGSSVAFLCKYIGKLKGGGSFGELDPRSINLWSNSASSAPKNEESVHLA